ncbi:phage tail tape measure protein [Bacillus sp. S0628]|uniref:phage tail tape measure protein n=1 Tax=Bacillus sp. S0628 TaxID=2957802 RepID=UPI00209D71BB|nr:phage tail tape measure protein [Bacillus sp. S0628]
MANKIGIEVGVEFPTVGELQAQLAQKWAKVKNGFEGKINIDIDGNSLKSAKAKIKTALKEDAFEIKLKANVSDALKSINTFHRELKQLDQELNKKRELKIDVKGIDLDAPLRDVLSDAKKMNDAMDSLKSKTKGETEALREQAGQWSKINTLMRQVKDKNGDVITLKTRSVTENVGSGVTKTTTEKPNGTMDVKVVEDRIRAMKELESIAKKIHQIEMEQVGAEGKHYQLLERERGVQNEQLRLLSQQYAEKHKLNAMEDNSMKELKRQQEVALEAKMLLALKQQEKQANNEIAQAVSKVAQLEAKKNTLAVQMVNATEQEKASQQELYAQYERTQAKIKEKHNLQEKMNSAQKDEMDNLRTIGMLQVQQAEAKKQALADAKKLSEEERKASQEQREALRQMKADLQDVHRIKLKIAEMEERKANGGNGDEHQLAVLRQQLEHAQRIQQANRQTYESLQLITRESQKQLNDQQKINQLETERVQIVAKGQAQKDIESQKQDEINSKLKEYQALQREINSLQRDLAHSGIREREVIEQALQAEKQKSAEMREELERAGALTAERRQEIHAIEQAQQAQQRLNRLRQEARDKDKALNNTGGLIDPYSTYANMEQGIRAVLEPMKQLDEAYIGVAKVAEATDESLKEFKQTSYDVATALGVTASEYMKAVETWVTAGKSFEQSKDLASKSLIGSFVGNISPDDMVKYMSVPMNAFEKEGLESADVINIMNETANNHAVEMTELGKAYMRSSGTVKTAGVSFEQLTGMITGAQEATRMGGERIGTAIKTIGINFGNIKAQLTKDTQKKFSFFDSIGVNLKEADGLYDAMEKLQGKWGSLTQEQQTTAMFYLAGKEHSSIMGGMIDQWDTVKKSIAGAYAEMGKGEKGSAYKEFGKQSDSLKFKLAELKNAWAELMNNIGSSNGGAMGDLLSTLTAGLQKLSDLVLNPTFAEALKFGAIAVGMHAATNGVFRLFETMNTGWNSTKRNASDIKTLWKGLRGDIDSATEATRRFSSTQSVSNLAGAGGSHVNGTRGANGSNSNRPRPDVDVNVNSRSRGNQAQNAERQLEGTNSKLKLTGNLIGKVVGMIPLVGDALMLMDLMGVPVFDAMGKGWDMLFKSAGATAQEYKKQTDQFLKDNALINGEIAKTEANIKSMQERLDKTSEVDKAPDIEGKQSWMEDEEFAKFKNDFNSQAEAMGVKVRIEVNDLEEAKAKLKELQDEVEKTKQKSTIEIAGKVEQDYTKLDEAKQKIGELKYVQEGVREKTEAVNKEMSKLGDSPEDDARRKKLQADLKVLNKDYDGLEKEIQEVGVQFNSSKDSIKESSLALLAQGSAVKASNLTMEQSQQVIPGMIGEYRNMKNEQTELTKIQQKVADGHKLDSREMKILSGELKQYANTAPEKIAADKDLQKEIGNNINKKLEEKGKTLETAKASIDAVAKRAGVEVDVQGALTSTGEATDTVKGKVEEYSGKIDAIKPEKSTLIKIVESGWDMLQSISNKLEGLKDKTVNVVTNVWEQVMGSKSGDSKSVASSSVSASSRSSSVSASGIPVRGIGRSTAGKGVSKSESGEYSNENATVSEAVWRYWGKEMYTGGKLEQELKRLTDAITNAKDDQEKLIPLYRQQQALLRQQISYNNSLSSSKDAEMNEVLDKLAGYGFWVDKNSNTIGNLDHARGMKGESAQKADELLNRWKSLYTEMGGIQDTIMNLNTTINGLNDSIEKGQIAQELKNLESTIKRATALMTKVNNSDAIDSRKLGLVDNVNKELALKLNAEAMNNSKRNMTDLINEFNRLATTTVNFKENGSQIQSQLQSMSGEIMAQADAIMKYRQTINDIEFSRLTEDMNKFNGAVDANNTKIDNVIKNLQDGLLSRTEVGDLYSSNMTKVDFSRDNELDRYAKERIRLEKEIQEALEGYAKKNVERTEWVANSTLDINKNMYNKLLNMEHMYTNGKDVMSNTVSSSLWGDLTGISDIDGGYANKVVGQFAKYLDEVQKKQEALLKKYERNMASAMNADGRESLTNQYILDSMKLQEEYLRANIKGNSEAIEELNRQLNDSSLTDSQREKIKQQIDAYEKDNVNAQNSIKDTIKKRFEFEFSLISKAVKEYDKASSNLEYLMSINSLLSKGDTATKGTILGEMLSNEKGKNSEIRKSLSYLKQQLSMYEKGSFEWNLINKEIETYNKQLNDSNKELIEMNKNIMSNSFNSTMSKLEKYMFGGQSQKAWKQHQELWMEGLEREIALEKMYKRMADLGTTVNEDKLALLEKQEKLSRFEMDYLNKQLDIVELQNKINNLNQEKKVQTLKVDEFGRWDWTYEADQTELDKAKDELNKAELELQKMEEKARQDYLSELEKILKDAEEGEYESIEDFQNAITDLGEAFESIVGDMPEIQGDYVKQLVEAYSKYISENGNVLENIPLDELTKPISKNFGEELKKTFTEISSELGKVFADALLSRLPNMMQASATSRSVSSTPTHINIDNVEFPNIKTADGIKDAILSLPQIALQKSKNNL